jgi:hypothetical protein
MKIGVFATFMSPIATPAMIRDFGKRAENIGLDSIWMGEHVVLFDKNTFGYPSSKDGRIPVPEGGGMLDVTATFGFLAAAPASCASAQALHSYPNAIRSTPPRKSVRWTGLLTAASTSASALAGTRRRSKPAAIGGKIGAGAATNSLKSCVGYGPSLWWISRVNG